MLAGVGLYKILCETSVCSMTGRVSSDGVKMDYLVYLSHFTTKWLRRGIASGNFPVGTSVIVVGTKPKSFCVPWNM